jgi:hypothetical protein
MKVLIATVLVLASISCAEAKGCLKGAFVGGIAGHVATRHGVMGALAGCYVGWHNAKRNAQIEKNQVDRRDH